MYVYQVVQPFQYAITADSFKDAVKNFVKIHRELNLANIIIKDQNKYVEARFKYWFEDGRNRIGISTFPYSGPITIGPSYINYYESLPGATGVPLSPTMPSGTPVALSPPLLPFSPLAPYTPISVTTDPFIPTIVTFR